MTVLCGLGQVVDTVDIPKLLFTEDVVGMHVEVEGTTSDTDDGSLVSLLAHGKAVLTSGKAFALPLRLCVAFFFCPLLFGIPTLAILVVEPLFLLLRNHCKNFARIPRVSATASVWEQTLYCAQPTHALSHTTLPVLSLTATE